MSTVYKRKEAPTESKLLNRTMELMRERNSELTYDVIAAETGLGFAWLARLMSNRVKNPNVIYVEALHDYLVWMNENKATRV